MDRLVKRNREKMNITVSPKVKELAKAAAMERGISASRLIEKALRRYLLDSERKKRVRSVSKQQDISQ